MSKVFPLLTVIFITLTVGVVLSQVPGEVRITRHYTDMPLREVLNDLREVYGFNFFFGDQYIDSVTVTADINNQDVRRALKILLKKSAVDFHIHEDGRITLHPDSRKDIFHNQSAKQTFTLRGHIVDEVTQDGIPAATIYLQNMQKGVVSDLHGEYEIKNLPRGVYVVHYSFLGHEKKECTVDLQKTVTLDVSLREQITQLQPVEISPSIYKVSVEEPSSMEFNEREILFSPNAVKDVSRTMRLFPGLANNDFSAKPHIRGGSIDESVFYLDNFEIMEPFHLEEINGLFSVINTDYVSSLKVIPGGFSTGYADKISGVIDIKTADRVEENKISLSADMVNSTFLVKRRFDDKTDLQISARRTYLDFLFKDGIASIIHPISFDGWARFNYTVNNKNSFSFNFLHAADIQSASLEVYSNKFNLTGNKNNDYAWVNWKYKTVDGYSHITTAGYQHLERFNRFDFNNSRSSDNVDNRVVGIASLRHTSYQALGKNSLEFGGEIKHFNARFRFRENRFDIFGPPANSEDSVDLNTSPSADVAAVFFQNTIAITPKFDLMAGVRTSYFGGLTNPVAVAPRISALYKFNDRLSVKAAYGVYNQCEYLQNMRVFDGETKPWQDYKQSLQYIGNITWATDKTSMMVNGYYKDNKKLEDDYRYDVYNRMGEMVAILDQPFGTVSGYSKGVEWILRQKYSKKSSLSVSYAYAINKIRNAAGEEAWRDNDRRHSFIVNNVLSLRRYWTIGLCSVFFSGEPYSSVGVKSILLTPGSHRNHFYEVNGKNTKRLPDFYSLDLRIDKSWYFRKWNLNVYLNVINVTNHENVRNYWRISYEKMLSTTDVIEMKGSYISKLLILPGISASF